jgi:hypothetical protein
MTHEPESLAYQAAFNQWEEFQSKATDLGLGARLRALETTPASDIAMALHALPPAERAPVAFGVFLTAAHRWRPCEQSVFLGEFLTAPSAVERYILEAAARGVLKPPAKLPVTVEEFPSRLWHRAVASGVPARIVAAGHQSVLAMLRLIDQYGDEEEDGMPGTGDGEEFRPSSDDLPAIMDLLGLPPTTLPEMKDRVLGRIAKDVTANRVAYTKEQLKRVAVWTFAGTPEGPKHVAEIINQSANLLRYPQIVKSTSGYRYAYGLGRFLFRLGLRGKSMYFARLLGLSPWAHGWQFQAIARDAHARIRKLLVKPGMMVDAWQQDPALACSAMSLPLWLTVAVSRVPALLGLFHHAHACPWVFPRLHHVFQWHLALAGKQSALSEIEIFSPDCSVGLAAGSHLQPLSQA